MPFVGTFWGYWVDGEDDLLVAPGASQVGESVGEPWNDCSTAGGVHSDVGVVAV
jgi:hypothetical protein